MTEVGLAVEADAVVRDEGGAITRIPFDQEVTLTVIGDRGGAIGASGAVCESLPVSSGPFTFRIGSDAGIHYVYDELDGSPCCWIPTEYVVANVVVNAIVDAGQGETTPRSINSSVAVASIPRPSDPCEVRFYPTDQPVVNTNRYHAREESGDFVSLGYAYLTDACDNVVHGVGMEDSEKHNQPGDEFRIVNPPEPPEGGSGVWATGHSTPNEWTYLLALRGRTPHSATQIPDGTYVVDFEVASQSQCSQGGYIYESIAVQAFEMVPRLTIHWDMDFDGEVSLRGNDPRYSAIAPGSTVRDASDRIAVWRVPAYDDPDPGPEFEGPFTAVPVKIYVADVGTVPFDWEGNVRETYLEPVEGVVLCTGIVEEKTDKNGTVMIWQGPVQSSCDQTWTTIAEGFASSDPQLIGNAPHSWIPMGLGVGIVKAPEQTGSYVLVVEPQDESFRRGDSWRIDSTWLPDNFMKFEVGGGVYLDEDYERFGATIDVPETRQIYVQAKLDSLEPTVTLNVEYTDPENKAFQTATVTMNRVGLADDGEGESVYLSEVIDLVLEGENDSAKGVTPLAVKVGGKLESWFGDKLIAVATIENDGPVDLDIDGDNNNGSGLPDRSSREEDLETDGYGKFVFVNHNDDDGDGVPDYADLDVSEERNFVPMVLYIDLPEIEWADISISFDFDGITVLNTEPEEIPDPRDQSPTGFFDYRTARREYVEGGSWRKPPIRLWMTDDPSQPRSQTDLLSPRITYTASELGFGQGDDPKRVVFYVEGVNQTGPLMSQPQASAVRVDVSAEDENYEDSIVLTVVQPDLGLNNSSNDPFSGTGSLRPGIPDVEFEIDEYDDLVEDQKEGFVFWRAAKMIDTDVISTFRDADPPDKLVNFFPVRIEIPEVLTEMGFLAYIRIRADHNEAFEFVMNPSDPDGNILEYLQDPTMAQTTRYIATELTQLISNIPSIGADRLRLDTTESTFSVLLSAMPDSLTWGLDAPDVAGLRIELVLTQPGYPIDGMVVDSAVVTIKKLTWENGLANNQQFWMGSSGRVLNAGLQYPIDVVDGTSAYQAISIYDGFSHQSGPTPDSGKQNFVVFVHGFNVNPDLAFESSAEFYKRLFFAGYRGNFIGLNWHGDEDDPHQHNCPELTPFDAPCVAKFEPNIVNAFQTSSALEKFLRLRVGEIWGAESSNVYLVAHSLGNQVSFDALRLSSALHPDNGPLVKHMVSVEAAVWEETFWPVEEVHYANHYYTIDELKRGSWAFWFNQAESPVSASAQRIINSYSPEDRALWLMKVGNWYASSGNNRDRRVDRAFDRGTAKHFRVPVADGLLASDPENRPDLSLEIPALIKGNVLMTYPGWNDFTSPLGTVPNPLVGTYSILAVGDLGWTEKGHSDFLAEPFSTVWPWYEKLMALDENLGNESVLPRGEE